MPCFFKAWLFIFNNILGNLLLIWIEAWMLRYILIYIAEKSTSSKPIGSGHVAPSICLELSAFCFR